MYRESLRAGKDPQGSDGAGLHAGVKEAPQGVEREELDARSTEALEQDGANAGGRALLVERGEAKGLVERLAGEVGGQAEVGKEPLDTRGGLGVGDPKGTADTQDGDHAEGDGFAMGEAGVRARSLEPMANGVAEVEQDAVAGLTLVPRDDVGLHADGAEDHFPNEVEVPREDTFTLAVDELEEGKVGNGGRLDDLGEAGDVGPRRLGPDAGGVDEHGRGLVEGADGILGDPEVDAGLPPNGRIHHREQGRGHGDPADASKEEGRGKPGNIGDDAPAKRHDEGLAVGARLDEGSKDSLDGRELLVGLAGRKDDGGRDAESSTTKGIEDRVEGKGRDVLIGDDEDGGGGEVTSDLGEGARRVVGESNGVGTSAEGDDERGVEPGLEDSVGELGGGAIVGTKVGVCLGIDRGAGGEEAAEALEAVGCVVEEGPAGNVGACGEGVGSCGEGDDVGVGERKGAEVGVEEGAAAECNDARFGGGEEAAKGVGLERTEGRFAAGFGEEGGDGAAGGVGDVGVEVEEGDRRLGGDEGANGGFATAHEAREEEGARGLVSRKRRHGDYDSMKERICRVPGERGGAGWRVSGGLEG